MAIKGQSDPVLVLITRVSALEQCLAAGRICGLRLLCVDGGVAGGGSVFS